MAAETAEVRRVREEVDWIQRLDETQSLRSDPSLEPTLDNARALLWELVSTGGRTPHRQEVLNALDVLQRGSSTRTLTRIAVALERIAGSLERRR